MAIIILVALLVAITPCIIDKNYVFFVTLTNCTMYYNAEDESYSRTLQKIWLPSVYPRASRYTAKKKVP